MTTIDPITAIRRYPGMYIGGNTGEAVRYLIESLIEEILDESSDLPDTIMVALHNDASFSVKHNANPRHMSNPDDESWIELMVTTLVRSKRLHCSNRVMMNALAESLIVDVFTGKNHYQQEFRQGEKFAAVRKVGATIEVGEVFHFYPDRSVLEHLENFSKYALIGRMRALAALTPGLSIEVYDESVRKSVTTTYPNGICDYLEDMDRHYRQINQLDRPICIKGGEAGRQVEVAFWHSLQGPRIWSFVNGFPTIYGGSHERGFWEGLTRGLDRYARMVGAVRRGSRPLRRSQVHKDIACVLAIRVDDPRWADTMRSQIDDPELQRFVKQVLSKQLPAVLKEHAANLRQFIALDR